MKYMKIAILFLLSTLLIPALAAPMVDGVDYQVCNPQTTRNPSDGDIYHSCIIPTTKERISVTYKDANGVTKVHDINGYFRAVCSETGFCKVYGSSDYVTGEFVGNAPEGRYLMTDQFYLDTDISGKPVAYKHGRGPKYNEEPVGSSWASEGTPTLHDTADDE